MSTDRAALLCELTICLQTCLHLVERLAVDSGQAELAADPGPVQPPGYSIPQIEEAVIRLGTFEEAAKELGVSKPTLVNRLRTVYGREKHGEQGATGVLLTSLVSRIGESETARQVGTSVANIRRWSQRRRIPAPARRAIARAAQAEGLGPVTPDPAGGWKPGLTIERIEELVVQHGSARAAARALGISHVAIQARLKAKYGAESGEAFGPTGQLLSQLVKRIGREAVVAELRTSPANVRRWQSNKQIPVPVRRAVADLAKRHGIAVVAEKPGN